MPKFAANLTYLFTELPMINRFIAAKEAGFSGVEVLFPYDLSAKELRDEARQAGLEFVSLNTPPANWAGGPRGFAAVPGLQERFRADFERVLRFAETVQSRHMHIMAGKAGGSHARAVFIENLQWACTRAPHASLTIGPMNGIDMPGYFLSDYDQTAQIIDAVGHDNLGLQFDSYHAHMISGDAPADWARHAARIRHVHMAGVPGRCEPDSGEVDYPALLRELASCGYDGWVSAAYHPTGATETGLDWMKARHAHFGQV